MILKPIAWNSSVHGVYNIIIYNIVSHNSIFPFVFNISLYSGICESIS